MQALRPGERGGRVMDWHVPLLVITVALAALAALALWRVHRQQGVVQHRIAIIAPARRPSSESFSACPTARKLEDILLETVHAIERIIPDCIGTIQLIENGKIRNGAAPGLPKFYNDLVEGLAIGEGVGSCGSAAAAAQAGHREDVFEHPSWAPYKEIARQAGFAACWSYPVIQPDGTVIATFATYYRAGRDSDRGRALHHSRLRRDPAPRDRAVPQSRCLDGRQGRRAVRQPRQEPLPLDDEP